MIEVTGNLWEYPAHWLCITTNPIINQQGLAVMGRGVALQAAQRYPDIRKRFAEKIQCNGNTVQGICRLPTDQLLLSFPVKHHWRDIASLELISYSAQTLKERWEVHGDGCTVAIPKPGCGNGGLYWPDVREEISPWLTSDQFHIIDLPRLNS
ncbi:MAG: ADP-ribose-binding protein [Cyanobacteria bacterium P01_F01_bin.3]